MAGAQDLNLGGSTFGPVVLPDGSLATLNQIGSHTFLEGMRDALANGCVGDGATDDGPALNTLANTTLSAGGIIYLGKPPSSYRIKTSFVFPSNVLLIFCPGATLNIDTGIYIEIDGTVIAPNATLFSGLGVPFFGSGATRSRKSVIAAAPFSIYGSDNYLPKPGDTPITVTVPKFSTVRSVRLVIVDAHPADGKNATYLVKDGSGATTYISQTQNGGDPATVVELDAELTLPHVTGNDASFILSTTGTDQVQYKGWVEIEYY